MTAAHLARTALFAVLALAFVPPALAQDPAARMDQVVQSYVDAKQFMGSVLVARGDQIVFNKSYGSANLEWNIANTPTTKFRLGSVTKQFTAASILLLEERGKLKVEDLVKKHYPDAPAAWDAITIFHLLTHSAGLPNFTSFPEYGTLKLSSTSLDATIQRIKEKPLEFKPGEQMKYSNSGYLLLGALVEKVSGVSYEKFLQENIFTPLGMKDSGYDSNTAIIPRRAAGYAPSPAGPVNAAFIDMSIPHGAGALYSTTEDLLKWQRGLYGNKLLSAASLQKMTTPFKSNYAFGVLVNAAGRKVIQHGGGIEGFNTMLAYYPDEGVTVVALSNLNGQAPDQIVAQLGTLAFGGTVQLTSERKEIVVPVETLGKYVGTYSLAPSVNVMITLEGQQLVGQVSGQTKNPLFAESETRFFLKVVNAQVEFFKDAGNAVTHLILYQNGRETRAARTSDTVVERKEISLPTEKLRQYVGTYTLRPGLDLVLTVENDQLMAQATGQPKGAYFADSERTFFSKRIDVQFEFAPEPDGKITHMIFRQGAATIKAPKK